MRNPKCYVVEVLVYAPIEPAWVTREWHESSRVGWNARNILDVLGKRREWKHIDYRVRRVDPLERDRLKRAAHLFWADKTLRKEAVKLER